MDYIAISGSSLESWEIAQTSTDEIFWRAKQHARVIFCIGPLQAKIVQQDKVAVACERAQHSGEEGILKPHIANAFFRPNHIETVIRYVHAQKILLVERDTLFQVGLTRTLARAFRLDADETNSIDLYVLCLRQPEAVLSRRSCSRRSKTMITCQPNTRTIAHPRCHTATERIERFPFRR